MEQREMALSLHLRTITRTFCHGADAYTPELRAPSIKGQLRWWYRAWRADAVFDAGGIEGERQIMGVGGKKASQGLFSVRVGEPIPLSIGSWQQLRDKPGEGVAYLAYPFDGNKEEGVPPHKFIEGNSRIDVVCKILNPKKLGESEARRLIGTWWLFAHLGGLGARSRRGFGSFALERWSWPAFQQILNELPLPSACAGGELWKRAMREGLATLEKWRGAIEPPLDYPHAWLGPESTVVLQTDTNWRRPADALDRAGTTLKELRRQHRGSGPIDGRVTVGLPLKSGNPAVEWEPFSFRGSHIEGDVHASPLHIHVAKFPGGCGLVWTRMAGPTPGRGDYRVGQAGEEVLGEAPDTLSALDAALDGDRWSPGAAA